MTTITAFPKIVRFTGSYDGGPTDGGRDCVLCPHCGAKGRYIFWFITEDGAERGAMRGAMRGCLKLFPVSEIASEHRALLEKQTELRKKYGPDAHLNSWATKMLEAIDAYYANDLSMDEALATVRREKAAQAAYRSRKGGRY